ncbi:glycosyltransferase [Phormidium sp. CLA17]|uniref:glycosyltransferase family 4 protein n=1 Tax=Leptolyngbya sp. Cla-17 TaxID=2803751 RepID=UPI0014917A00|nr:glycosyltransferase [Leptolyngbya sp. Cla-17]MBM0743678.1 glycosyltransferase [Leptolyngbya sp. Cla-17]
MEAISNQRVFPRFDKTSAVQCPSPTSLNSKVTHWTIVAPFIHDLEHDGQWLAPYVSGARYHFNIIPRPRPLRSWHNRASSVTNIAGWVTYLQHGKNAVQTTDGGVITVFPQLASAVGMCQQLSRRQIPVVAWLFNVGTCQSGVRRRVAQASLQHISRFVVHTRRECDMYSQWLGLPKERFVFFPYQVADIPVIYEENATQPFIAAIGSAHRDFPTLFQAVEKLKLPTVVASGSRALTGLQLPSHVQAPLDLGKQDCLRLAQEARINIVPMTTNAHITAAGQVTIVEAMRMGRVVIASRCNGAEDYIIHGETGLLVEPGSTQALVRAIEMLWDDPQLRNKIGHNAKNYAAQHFSDEAAGAALQSVLDDVGLMT